MVSNPPDVQGHLLSSSLGPAIEGAVVDGGGLRLELTAHGVRLPSISLGLMIDEHDLSDSEVIEAGSRVIADRWDAVSGKSTGTLAYEHVEHTYRLRTRGGLDWELHLRAAPDGVAFRYASARLDGHRHLVAERTGFALPAHGRAWVLDYQTWYETPRVGVDVTDLVPGAYGFPFLLRLGGPDDALHLLLTEADIDGRFSGSHATVDAAGGLSITPADERREVVRGPLTPWRVLHLGTLAEIVASRFVDELAPAPFREIAGPVRPGRAAWSWWSDFYSGAQLDQQRRFVDRAAEFGWEHLLIDCGWDATWVPDIVAYASLRGVQVHLWAVWHDLDGPEKLSRLDLWRSWGVAGVKIDFMESEAKDRYRWYDSILLESARLGLMVNFHGSVIPRGWARTWPQVIGYEAIRGAEYYVFFNDTPLTSSHNVIQPFTRNVVGAMDYTPVAFTAPGRTTSDGHELALAIAFECGITNFADDVEEFVRRPSVARALSELAPVWDETLLIAGTPDTEAVVARRSGDRWFVGVIATGAARSVTVPLDRLGGGRWQSWLVTDGEAGLQETLADVTDGLTVRLAADGGAFTILARPGSELFRAVPRAVAAAPVVEPARTVLEDGVAVLRTAPSATLRLPLGWSADGDGDGTWSIRAPRHAKPGEIGVIAVEEDGLPGVPLVSHARVLVPFTAGVHALSAGPLLSFRNHSGPVERDMSNGAGNPADGQPMRIAGEPFADGFGTSTPSEVELYVAAADGEFTVAVGVDDETSAASAHVEVLVDGVVAVRTDIEAGSPAVRLSVPLAAAQTVTLRATGTAAETAHVDWAEPRLAVRSG